MSISTYLRPNIHQNGLEIYGLIFFFLVPQVETILIMPRGGNCRGVAAPLDMVIFESDENALLGWDMLSPHKDQLWIPKQCKNYITGSHIARLWYCEDMDAIRGWLDRWEFCMTACAIPEFALRYTEVIRFTRGGQNLPTCTYSKSQWYMRR
jgi:hypothetical protein